MPSGAVTVGGLVINLAAETSQLKTDMADGARAVDAGAKAMINSMTGVTESSDRATDAGARMVRQLREEIATFGMTSEQLTQYKANLNGVGGEVEALMGRLNQMKGAQAGFSDQLAASEAQAAQRIKEMVAASMSEVAAMNDVAAATQGVITAQAAAVSTGRTLAETQKLQILNMQGVAASMRAAQEATVAMSADTQRILAQYDPLGAKLRALQADLATLRKEMGNSVDPAAIKAFQGLEDEISKTQRLMAQAAAQATALGGANSQLTLTQTQLIDRFKQQADTIGMSRSQLMSYQAAQAGVIEQTKDHIAKIKQQEDALKAAAKAKEDERNQTSMLSDAYKLLAAGYAALKVGEYIKDATMLAARYETLDVVMGVVGKTAGYTKTQMEAASEGVAKQGITMTESRNSVIKLVQAHIDLSNASALARIAQDAAVIGNINSSEAFERLVNGVSRGNVLILRNIGINVNLQAAYAQMADSLGKSTRELTENERVQARLNAVLERGTDIAGTYEAAMDTASKQITSMKRYSEDLKTTLGEVFSESLTIGVMALTDGLKDANGEVSELAKNGQLAEWGRELTSVFVGIANTVGNAFTTFQKFDTFARHLDARKAINAQSDAQSKKLSDYGNGMAEKGAVAKLQRIEAGRAAALAEEDASYVARQAELSGNFDRFQRAAETRMATRLAKQKADAEERLKVDQDYAARATALLVANAGKSIEVQQAAQANLAKEVYQGTPKFRDSEERASKPKVDQADNTRLQSHLARLQDASGADKAYAEYRLKLDDMLHKSGEMSDEEYFKSKKESLKTVYLSEQLMYTQQIEALRAHHNSTAAETEKSNKAIADIQAKQQAASVKFGRDDHLADEEERLREKKLYDDTVKATINAGAASIKSLDDQITKQREHNAEIGKTKEQIELAKKAQVDIDTAQMQSDADYLRGGLAKWDLDDKSRAAYEIRLANLDGEISRRRTLSELLDAGADAEAGAKAVAELNKYLDPAKAKEFGNALKGSLGTAARSMADLTKAMQQYGREQEANEEARKNAEVARRTGEKTQAEYFDVIGQINSRNTKQQISSYGTMAGAAAGFFDEHSRGYQALTTVSQVFHAAELAMTMAELVPKAISAVLTQGQGDPYTAFGRMAAMGALVAGLGVAIGGVSGADTTAKDRQKAQGAGSILGDKDAKSESISKSLDLIEKNTYQDLAISSGMLASLRSIDANILNFANQLVRGTDITSPKVGLNSSNGLASTVGTVGLSTGGALLGMTGAAWTAAAGSGITASALASLGSAAGPVGAIAGAIVGMVASKIPAVGKLMTGVFGGKQSLQDSGFSMDAASLANILSSGAKGYQYADIKTSGGWFRSDKTSVKSNPLDDAANQQFTAIIGSLAGSIKMAGVALGLSGDDFTNKLNNFVVDIGKVSLKDLKGDELQKAIESVFAKLGDDMAQFAVGGLAQFQDVGEGYLETLARIATEYQTIDVVFQSFGKTFSLVGMESIAARDRLVDLAGGLDKFTSQGEYFLTNFFSEQEQAAALKKRINPTLAQYGLSTEGTDASKLFRDFLVGLDTTTQAGAEAYTALMAIAPAFKNVVDSGKDALDDLADAEQKLADQRSGLLDQLNQLVKTEAELTAIERTKIDASNQSLFDQVQAAKAVQTARDALNSAYQTEQQNIVTLRDRMQSLSSTWSKLLADLKLGDSSPLTPQQKYLEAKTQYDKTLAAAKGGDKTAQDNYESVAKAFLSASRLANASSSTYTSDFNMVQAGLTDAATWASQQVDVAKASLEALNAQVAGLIDIKKEVVSVRDAMAALGAAIAKASSIGAPLPSDTSISGLYETLLGRAPDAAGLSYWKDVQGQGYSTSEIANMITKGDEYEAKQIKDLYQQLLSRPVDDAGLAYWQKSIDQGVSLNDIANMIKQSTEYQALHPSVVNSGSSAQSAKVSAASSNAPTAAQVQTLIDQISGLRTDQQGHTSAQVNATLEAAELTATAVSQGAAKGAETAAYQARNMEMIA